MDLHAECIECIFFFVLRENRFAPAAAAAAAAAAALFYPSQRQSTSNEMTIMPLIYLPSNCDGPSVAQMQPEDNERAQL